MAVTLAEIDSFVGRLMDEKAGPDYSERLGRKTWYLKHRTADQYGCPPCRPTFQALENVSHNTVNVKLDKKIVNPSLYHDGVKLVMETYQEYRSSRAPPHHSADRGTVGTIAHTVPHRAPHAVHSARGEITH